MENYKYAEGSTTSRLIVMGASLLGDTERLRNELGCSPEDFRAYLESGKQMPWPELDKLINIILREQGHIIAANRDLTAKLREKREGQ